MKDFLTALKRFSSKAFAKSLDYIELVGNKLPHPATLFLLLAIAVMVLSWVSAALNVSASHPVDGSLITVNNLISAEGFR